MCNCREIQTRQNPWCILKIALLASNTRSDSSPHVIMESMDYGARTPGHCSVLLCTAALF